jgi:DNA-binding NarL/FixJ family response regulator
VRDADASSWVILCGMPAGASIRVLLIDDLPEMRRLVGLWLDGTRARVVGQATSCSEALAVIERQRPDVVVMDMNMPGADGVACTADLLARHPRLLVVAFSSSDDPAVETAMREAGAIAYFHKSRLQDLIACLTSPELQRQVHERREG